MSDKTEKDLSAAVMTYQKAYYETKEQLSSLQGKLSCTEQELEAEKRFISSLQEKLREVEGERNVLQETLDILLPQNSNFDEWYAEFHNCFRGHSEESESIARMAYEKAKVAMAKELDDLRSKLSDAERELDAERKNTHKVKSLWNDETEKRHAAESRAQQAEQSLAELTESTTALQQNYHKVMEDREKGLEEIARREMELRRVERERDGAVEEKLGLVVDCERLATDLEQALRQWKMYAEEREDEDLEKESHAEALSYRAAVKMAKDWRDKAFSLAYPNLSITSQSEQHTECSICRRRHGSEIQHPCE